MLAERYRVIGVELQGHGRTASIDRACTPANNAADIIALLDHLGLPRAATIGHSTGAATALELAVHHAVLKILGDLDFVPFDHLTVMQQLIRSYQIGVLPGTPHTQLPTRADLLGPMLTAFLSEPEGQPLPTESGAGPERPGRAIRLSSPRHRTCATRPPQAGHAGRACRPPRSDVRPWPIEPAPPGRSVDRIAHVRRLGQVL